MRRFLLILALAVFTPIPASAVTLDGVVALSKGGVSEQVILALIERDQTLYTMSPAQLMKLQREGLSDTILLALLKSGRPTEASIPASPAPSTLAAAAAPPSPDVVIVGHGPDFPNTQSADRMALRDPPAVPAPMVIPVPVPYPVPQVSRRSAHRPERHLEHTVNPLLCVERVSTGMSPFAPALTRVTECPAVMQR